MSLRIWCWVTGWIVFDVSYSAFIFRVKHSKKIEHFFSLVKLLLLEMSSFSERVSDYQGSYVGDTVGVQSFSLQHSSWWRFATLYQGHQLLGNMMLDPMWCRLVYPECIFQNVPQLSVGVPSACSSDHNFHMVVQSGLLICMLPVLYFVCSTVNNLDCFWLYGIIDL